MASNFSNSFNWTSVPIFPPIVDSPPPPPPPFVVYPGDPSVSRGYAVYGCFIVVLVLVFIAIMIKISISRKRLQARNANIRQNIRARQNQLSTLSRSVDSNTNNSNNVDQNRRRRHGSDETLKLDLPPTYEEVMSNSPQIREQPPITLTIPPDAGETLQSTTDTHASVSIEIVTDPITQRRRSLDP